VAVDFTTLTLTDVSRNFGRRRALNRITIRAEAGELVAVLGPNGAGKSTLLSILATLLAPSSGDVRYGTLDASRGGSALRGRIGLLAHDLYVYPELSPAENLRFFARAYELSDTERRIDEALERAELSDRRGYSRSSPAPCRSQRPGLHRADDDARS
jgi:heme exporter protein A